jgi:MoaA/NifB/PqqE/SkfB family radical SAM enzyme
MLAVTGTTLNVESLPEVVRLAADLGVDEMFCNYMTIYDPSHLKLSCFFKQGLSNDGLDRAEETARKLGVRLRGPARFGAAVGEEATCRCNDPWKYFYVENETSVLPCCYAGDHVGYLEKNDFWTIWNGTQYMNLRQYVHGRRTHEWCRYCCKNDSRNVNDIRAHINSRPGFRDRVLKGNS